jgi:hypothetical protein
LEELSEDCIAVFAILQADTSVAISPHGLIHRICVIDNYVLIWQGLLADIGGGMRYTNGLRKILLKKKNLNS